MSSSARRMLTRMALIIGLALGIVGSPMLPPPPARANVQPSCSTNPLFTNGTFVTEPGRSVRQDDIEAFGFLADPVRAVTEPPDGITRARLADDFTVSGNGWRPSAITLYGYEINSGTTSTITGVVDLRLWNGTPGNGGTVIAGPVNGTITRNEFTGVYRVPSDNTNNQSRPIMALTLAWPFNVTTLAPGTYWLEYGLTGDDNLRGPWTPPTNATSGNARQLNLTGGEPGTWSVRTDYPPRATSGRTFELPFVICGNPVPAITSLSPASATAGGDTFTLTVNGSGFSNNSVVRWNGTPRSTTFVSATQLTAQIPASDIAAAGTANVTVLNPNPDVESAASTFTINNPAPAITSLSPASATAGGPAFTLTVTGSNFVNGAVVRWNDTDRPTTFVSATQLTAQIPASDIAAAGTASITVVNPAPGGGTSNSVTFTINASNPVPAITSLSPATVTAGGPAFTLTVTGSNFVNGAVVRWNGADRPTTFVSATQLTAQIPASDIAAAGTASITVVNPAPGGGVSGAATLTIRSTGLVYLPLIRR
ncbi:MAG: IPT/TIG domain-containing protein [Chloroflexaceae bacterium]|nr:IPT/TIG domain-containing protein [Chloroflexaceae bacterium]